MIAARRRSILEEASENDAMLPVLAGWYERRGEDARAACVRWCVRRGVRPCRNTRLENYDEVAEDYWTWAWGEGWEALGPGVPLYSRIPAALFRRLRPAPGGSRSHRYPTARQAWAALLSAWEDAATDGRSPEVCR